MELIKNNNIEVNRVLVIVFMIILTLPVALNNNSGLFSTSPKPNTSPNLELGKIPDSLTGVYLGAYDQAVPANPDQIVNVMVSLKYQHPDTLEKDLVELQTMSSPNYHHFMTKQEFINQFSPDKNLYNNLAYYFTKNNINVKKYDDRVSLSLHGSIGQFEQVFQTQITNFELAGNNFTAPSSSLYLNSNYVALISSITGLTNRGQSKITPSYTGSGTSELFFGADFQKAYQLDQLYSDPNGGYPSGKTIAIILGVTNGFSPYDPNDINYYFNNYFPSSQPKPNVIPDPIDGAPSPGPNTQSGQAELTLDIEMAGSLAPGSNIVVVYGNGGTLDTSFANCFAEILNPGSNSPSALQNTVVISNSWSVFENDGKTLDWTSWIQYEQEAAARGMTVLASSGDNNNLILQHSSTGNSYVGTGIPDYPANIADVNGGWGTIGVGGVSSVLTGVNSNDGSGTTGIDSESVWSGTPDAIHGSEGGISQQYAEPTFQTQSPDANSLINGGGRGVPDISGQASYVSIYFQGSLETVFGTSIACPLVAGVIATMDKYMGIGSEGYFASLIYQMGQMQFEGTSNYPFIATYPPFFDVTTGSNGNYNALVGYDLVTGWGTINAYNFVQIQSVTVSISPPDSSSQNYIFDFTTTASAYIGISKITESVGNPYLGNPYQTVGEETYTGYYSQVSYTSHINPNSYPLQYGTYGVYYLKVDVTTNDGRTITKESPIYFYHYSQYNDLETYSTSYGSLIANFTWRVSNNQLIGYENHQSASPSGSWYTYSGPSFSVSTITDSSGTYYKAVFKVTFAQYGVHGITKYTQSITINAYTDGHYTVSKSTVYG